MFKLRLLVALTIWWLFLFFNVERMDSTLNLTPVVYVLVPVAAVMTVLIKQISTKNALYTIAPALIVYAVMKRLLGFTLLERSLAVTFTEMTSIVITLLLVREVLIALQDFEDTIDHITFRQLGLPPRVYESPDAEDLYREVKRSRRFQHPLSLLVIKPQLDASSVRLNDLMLDLQRAMSARYFQARLVKFLSEELRDTDLVAIDGDDFVVLLPETSEQDASDILGRLGRQAYHELGIDLAAGLASFPDQALTFTALMEAARRSAGDAES